MIREVKGNEDQYYPTVISAFRCKTCHSSVSIVNIVSWCYYHVIIMWSTCIIVQFLYENIVGSVIILSLVFWIPVSVAVHVFVSCKPLVFVKFLFCVSSDVHSSIHPSIHLLSSIIVHNYIYNYIRIYGGKTKEKSISWARNLKNTINISKRLNSLRT